MHIHEVVFMVVLTIVAIVWVRVFRSFINTQIEAKSYDAIQKYAAEQKNIDGDFVKRGNSMEFYTTKEFKKKKHTSLVAHDADTPHEDIIPEMSKSRFLSWHNDYGYDIIKRNPVEFIYNDTGNLWEEKMGVDFLRDGWYDDIVDIQQHIYNNITKNIEEELETFWKESNGYSRILYTKNYAFISNACVHVRNGQISLYMKSEMEVNKIKGDFKWKDFYFNQYKITQSPIPEKLIPNQPINLLVAHPRSVKNAYQFLEGTSFIAHIALHPEIFPAYKKLLVVAKKSEQTPDDWNSRVLQYFINMFPPSYRPELLYPYTDPQFVKQNNLCDKIITVIRNWEPIGSGSFIGTVLAADFFRASAYVYENYFPPREYREKIQLTIVRRPSNRYILNLDQFIQKINQKLLDYYDYDSLVFEEMTIDQRVKQLTKTDVFFGVFGTGLANMLFLTKDSYLIEAYPPFWFWSCYQRMAKSIGVKSVVFKSRGERGPECKNAEDKSTECQQKGIRDRNFNMSANDGITFLWNARTYVLQYKYHRDPSTLRFM